MIVRIAETIDIVASISILFHVPECENSISGNIGDKVLACGLIDHARDAIKSRVTSSRAPIIIPPRDVVVKQWLPTLSYGDMPPQDHGDQQKRLRTERGKKGIYALVSVELRSNMSIVVMYDVGVEDKSFALTMLSEARAAIVKRNFVPDPAQLKLVRP